MIEKENPMLNNQQLQKILEGVKETVSEERKDELFYDYLISVAPTKSEKDIIISIRNDERKHSIFLRNMYKDFTGLEIQQGGEENFEKPESYLDGIQKAIFRELKSVEKYREIRRELPIGPYTNILFDIITDELKHSSKYNYLFTLNSSKNISTESKSPVLDTSRFTPDDLVIYISSLVTRALSEAKEGVNPKYLYQKFIVSGVLVGLGNSPQKAINEVEEWEKSGASQLLTQSKMTEV